MDEQTILKDKENKLEGENKDQKNVKDEKVDNKNEEISKSQIAEIMNNVSKRTKEEVLEKLKASSKFLEEDEVKLKKEVYDNLKEQVKKLEADKFNKLDEGEETIKKIKAIEDGFVKQFTEKDNYITKIEKDFKELKGKVRSDRINGAIKDAALFVGAKKEYIPFVIEHLSKYVRFKDEINMENFVWLKEDGDPWLNDKGNLMDIKERVCEFATKFPNLFEPQSKSGTGIAEFMSTEEKILNEKASQKDIHEIYNNPEDLAKFRKKHGIEV